MRGNEGVLKTTGEGMRLKMSSMEQKQEMEEGHATRRVEDERE